MTALAATTPGRARDERSGTPVPTVVAAAIVYQLVVSSLDFGKLCLTSDGIDLFRLAMIAPGQFVLGSALLMWSGGLRRALQSPQLLLLLAWFSWGFASAAWSVDPQQTVIQTLGALNIWVTAVWAVDRYGLQAFARLFAIGISSVIAVGLPIDLLGLELFGESSERWSGLTSATNRLGVLAGLVLVSLVIMGRARLGTRPVVTTPMAAMAIVAVTASVGSGSRAASGFTLLAVGLQLVPAASTVSRRIATVSGLLLALVIGAAVVVSSPTPSSYTTGRSLDSLTGRGPVWAKAIERLSDRPLAGHGAFAELSLWTESYLRNDVSFEAFHSHNLVLTLLVTTGAIGCSLAMGAIIVTALRAILGGGWAAGRRSGDRAEPWRLDVGAVLLIIVGTGMTEASLDGPSPLFSLLGAAMALSPAVQFAPSDRSRSNYPSGPAHFDR